MEANKHDNDWYLDDDIHEALGMSQTTKRNFGSWLAKRYPMFTRRYTHTSSKAGRPSVSTYIDRTGLMIQAGEAMAMGVKISPATVPQRFSDRARSLFVDAGRMSTKGLEDTPRTLDQQEFFNTFVRDPRAAEFFENDFDRI